MPGPTRLLPYAGMAVRVMHLGVVEQAVIEDVADEGRTLVVGGESFTLRRINGRYVRAAEPWYGTRLLLPRPGADAGTDA